MNHKTPVISVVVPAYNAERFLAPTLESVLAQTFREWELIVVNDGSKDDTQLVAQGVAARDSRVRAMSQPNGGCGAARNFGLSQSDPASEYIIFLDHDDLWEPTALQTLLDTACGMPDGVGAVGAARVMQDAQAQQTIENAREKAGKAEKTGKTKTSAWESSRNGLERRQGQVNHDKAASRPRPGAVRADAGRLTFADMVTFNHIWTMGQTLIRRDALNAVGPLDTQCGPVDDWDLYLRLTLRGAFAATATPVIHWRSHASNTSKNKPLMRQYEDHVRAKLLASPALTPAQRELAQNSFQNAQRNLSAAQWKWAGESLTRGQFGEALKQMRRAVLNSTRAKRDSGIQKG